MLLSNPAVKRISMVIGIVIFRYIDAGGVSAT